MLDTGSKGALTDFLKPYPRFLLIFSSNCGSAFSAPVDQASSPAEVDLHPELRALIEHACTVIETELHGSAELAAPLEIGIFAGRRRFMTRPAHAVWKRWRERIRSRRCNIWSYDALIDEFQRVEDTWYRS